MSVWLLTKRFFQLFSILENVRDKMWIEKIIIIQLEGFCF